MINPIDIEVRSSPTRRIFTTAAEKKHAKRRNNSEKDKGASNCCD